MKFIFSFFIAVNFFYIASCSIINNSFFNIFFHIFLIHQALIQPKIKYSSLKSYKPNEVWCADVTVDSVQLFLCMIFNIIFCNKDDHFKNQSLIYNEQGDNWALAPTYDITYSLNPLISYKRSYRVLSVNGKKDDINFWSGYLFCHKKLRRFLKIFHPSKFCGTIVAHGVFDNNKSSKIKAYRI